MMYKAISVWVCFFLIAGCTHSKTDSGVGEDKEQVSDSNLAGDEKKVIVFFGNSLTAGYGVKISEAYPALIQLKIDSLTLPYSVVNAGVSGETTASGNSRIDWILENPLDVFVLELGGNDGLRGIPVEETLRNLQSIIEKVKTSYPEARIVLAGMQVPPNMGKVYSDEFSDIYPKLAEENEVLLIPFLLEGVGGERQLNQSDGIHPTAEGHKIVAETVWSVLRNVLINKERAIS